MFLLKFRVFVAAAVAVLVAAGGSADTACQSNTPSNKSLLRISIKAPYRSSSPWLQIGTKEATVVRNCHIWPMPVAMGAALRGHPSASPSPGSGGVVLKQKEEGLGATGQGAAERGSFTCVEGDESDVCARSQGPFHDLFVSTMHRCAGLVIEAQELPVVAGGDSWLISLLVSGSRA